MSQSLASNRANARRAPAGRLYVGVVAVTLLGLAAGWTVLARHQLDAGILAADADGFVRGRALFDGIRARTQDSLRAQCRVLVEDPRLKTTLATEGIDEPTVSDILGDINKLRRAGFLLVLSPDGHVFAEAGATELRGLDLSASSVLKAASAASEAVGGSWVLGGRLVDLGVAQVRFGPAVLAYVVVGQTVDAELLALVGDGTGLALAVIAGSAPGAVSSADPGLRGVFDAMARDGSDGILEHAGLRYLTHAVDLEATAQVRPRLAMARPLAPRRAWFEVLGWLLWAPLGIALLAVVLVAQRPRSPT